MIGLSSTCFCSQRPLQVCAAAFSASLCLAASSSAFAAASACLLDSSSAFDAASACLVDSSSAFAAASACLVDSSSAFAAASACFEDSSSAFAAASACFDDSSSAFAVVCFAVAFPRLLLAFHLPRSSAGAAGSEVVGASFSSRFSAAGVSGGLWYPLVDCKCFVRSGTDYNHACMHSWSLDAANLNICTGVYNSLAITCSIQPIKHQL